MRPSPQEKQTGAVKHALEELAKAVVGAVRCELAVTSRAQVSTQLHLLSGQDLDMPSQKPFFKTKSSKLRSSAVVPKHYTVADMGFT